MARTLAEEIAWLAANPAFHERPATLSEFLGPEYLNLESTVRKRIREELVAIVGDDVDATRPTKYSLAMITGGIGIGKTTVASIVLPYLVHWCLCLNNPQEFFDLMPGTRIAFMQMSTSEQQAKEVVFGDIKARIQHSPWFKKWPPDPAFKNQFRFDKEIWIIPGDSAETTFEGYNIMGGILDECDSHKVTKTKDYAEQGYSTIENRMTSRFQDRGFLLVIGQMKKSNGFAMKKFEEFCQREDAYAVRLAIWDSMGKDFYLAPERGGGKTFWYETRRKLMLPSEDAGKLLENANLIEVPELYRRQFDTNPEKALRDLAGIPPIVGNPFISLIDKIDACRDRWMLRYNRPDGFVQDSRISTEFRATESLRRVVHIDIGYADGGDALGLAMGHIRQMVEIDEELKPVIVIDLLLRLTAPAGGEIQLGDVRRILYMLKGTRKFRIVSATLDGFQSTDTIQQLNRRKIEASYLSVDRDLAPYYDLREAIYEDRIEFPPLIVDYRFQDGSSRTLDIAVKELTELVDNGTKIDHPFGGSKDVADALAGVCHTLMTNTTLHRQPSNPGSMGNSTGPSRAGTRLSSVYHPAYRGDTGTRAPLPPAIERR